MSASNLLINADFALDQRSPPVPQGAAARLSPAYSWLVWDGEAGVQTQVEVLAPGSPGGPRVMRVVAPAVGAGLVQQFAEPGRGPLAVLAQAWVLVVRGAVVLGAGDEQGWSEGAGSVDVYEWTLLRAHSSVSPANQFVLLAAVPETEFLVGPVSCCDLGAISEDQIPEPPRPVAVPGWQRQDDPGGGSAQEMRDVVVPNAPPVPVPPRPPVPPSIRIVPPQGPLAGVPITVVCNVFAGNTGGAEPEPYKIDGVSLQVDSGAQIEARQAGPGSWSAPVTFPWPGAQTLTATLTYKSPLWKDAPKQTVIATDGVTVGDQPVALNVVSPLTSASLTYQLQVDASSPIGVGLVVYSTDGGATWTGLITSDGKRWSAAVPLGVKNPVDPKNGAVASFLVGGFDQAQAPDPRERPGTPPSQQTVRVTALDSTPPTVQWQAPPEGSSVEVLAGATPEAEVTVAAVVTDDANGVVSAGLPKSPIACGVDGGSPVSLGEITGGDPALWQANVTLKGLGAHTLELVCTDNAGKVTTLSQTVMVREAGARTTSEQDYLADLLDYAGNRILTSVPGGRSVTPLDLADALCEPFLQLAGSGGHPRAPATLAQAPINAVRGAIEVLRAYLTPRVTPPAIGHWPLDEGTGTAVRDDTGSGCDGTLMSAGWGPGRAGGAAPVFNGTSSYVQVGALSQLDVRGEELTLAAWINPSGPGGGIVAERDQCYGLARINGTLQWILSTTKPGWAYQDTGIPVPQGQWSHVAVCYDGASIRAYLNGTLASTIAASGAITPHPAPGVDFLIGCRQTGNQLFFQGSIADVGVYTHALSQYEIRLLAGDAPAASATWLNGDLPAGAQVGGSGNEGFIWTTSNPPPFSAPRCHESPLASGVHQHFFSGLADPWPVDRGDRLYAYVYLDPANPPQQVMLQWFDDAGSWEHRAFWGADMTDWGHAGTASRRSMGPLPPAGQWVRLEVPAASVGLERVTVAGLAFTLQGGRAWWDVSGKTAGAAILAECGYPAAAYEALLEAVGASLEELRAARGAAQPARKALAGRLGFTLSPTRPDELDQLLLSPSTIGETDLERLFGLQRTDNDPLAARTDIPLLRGWQQLSLRVQWTVEDHATTLPSDYTPPVIDPDVVTVGDLLTPTPGQPAFDRWQQRTSWVDEQTRSLQQLRTGLSPTAGLTAMLARALPGFDLQGTAKLREEGHDISDVLAQALLDVAAFDRLLTLSNLAAAGPLNDDEWEDADAILVQIMKTRQFPAWRQDEQAAGLLLDPNVFQIATVTAAQLPRWRAAWAARQQWQDRLAARTDQLANIKAGLDSAVAAAERVALPVLRDAALEVAAPDDPDGLSNRLCIDLKVGPQLITTRLDQAVEAMQGLFAALDAAGGLAALGLSWTVPVPSGYSDLDAVFGELSWMSEFSSWKAAMGVFFYPENHILPSTRPVGETTQAFQDLLGALTGPSTGALTEQGARQLAAAYWNDESWGTPPQPVFWPISPAPPGYPLHPPPPATNHDPWPPHADPHATNYPSRQYPYDERLSEADLAALRNVERAQFKLKEPGSLTAVDPRLRELFFDLPVQLALSLAQAGQWRGALGWLRIVYDREQPRPLAEEPDGRQIFAGFALEPTKETISRDENWLEGGRLDPHAIAGERAHSYLRFTLMTIAGVLCDWADAEFSTDTAESRALARSLYSQALDVLSAPDLPAVGIPPNPELTALAGRAGNGLAKLRSALNIAGLTRPLASITSQEGPVALPAPTNYRYTTLVARAQQIVALAGQIEASYLASLEKKDNENYQQLLAQQDLGVAGAHVTIADEQATIATQEEGVGQLQVRRAQTQSDTYASWIAAGPNQYEQNQLTDLQDAQNYRTWAAQAQSVTPAINGIFGVISAIAGNPGGIIQAVEGFSQVAGNELSMEAENASTQSQIDAAQASWERRQDEWSLQKQLADADLAIGRQQALITAGRARVAENEAALARLTQGNAEAKLQFLQTKLTNAALYAWMAGVLAGVYRYMLQRAAAIARLAEQQLAFERQAMVPGYVKSDYWSAPTGGSVPTSNTAGLTGSARLLEDITQLDQYAFDTNTRKLQLTQTFSLATLAPVDLQRFRETGVLPFAVPLSSYGVPGIYLATIRSLRVSVAALIPPQIGIRATLAGGGSSRIVVKDGDAFDAVTLARAPETVVLTSPTNASGVFQVDLSPDLQLPWEGCGLDIPLELRMPKAINSFDYRTLADVQISIDYTALYSPDYAAQVIRELPNRTSNSIALSLRDFPDSWYQLLAQAQAATQATPPPAGPLLAQWELTPDAFPNNLSDLRVEQITLLAVRTSDAELAIDHLRLNGLPSDPSNPTAATTVDQIVSTRNGSGAAWNTPALIGVSPVGSWEVGLVADQPTIAAVADGDLQDLVLVIGYGASLPAWPT